jgi:hypothetical protein
MIMNGMDLLGEFVVFMQVALMPLYSLEEAGGNDGKLSRYR